MNLIEKLNQSETTENPPEQTEQTQFLEGKARQELNDDELLHFILSNPHNFSLNNTAAKKHRQELLGDLTGSKDVPGLARKEHEKRNFYEASPNGQDPTSVDFLLKTIKGTDFTQKANKDAFREKLPRKEIINQFPDKQTLSAENPSSYVLRKDIILLHFYEYWANDYMDGRKRGDYDCFLSETNSILDECGFSPLYLGNPYDWLFLYCSACADDDYSPLDRLREIFALGNEEDLIQNF
jgi:hypothetical protein